MEDTLKIELLTSLTGTFLPNKMEEDLGRREIS